MCMEARDQLLPVVLGPGGEPWLAKEMAEGMEKGGCTWGEWLKGGRPQGLLDVAGGCPKGLSDFSPQ